MQAASATPGRTESVRADSSGADGSYTCGVQQDFERLLYPNVESGSELFSSFVGRVQVAESDRATKGYRREYAKTANLFAKEVMAPIYVDRFFRVAQPGEECFRRAKEEILEVVRAHLRDL